MDKLLAGYRRFREKAWPERRAVFQELADAGQRPYALVVGCIDSRVDPAMIFDVGPGQILTVRNVANLVPAYGPDSKYHGTSAALEFGVQVLKVKDIIVLGHGSCGGVNALLEGAPATARDFVAPWMSIVSPVLGRMPPDLAPEQRQRWCEHEVVKTSVENLMTFPWIASRVAEGSLTLHGAWFAIHTGSLMLLQKDGTFAPAV
ncbi:MAG: carbonic anhydrase [Acidobacteriota bacterium]|nr:carbonic anhydrase [Acidobacteriota bacterium]